MPPGARPAKTRAGASGSSPPPCGEGLGGEFCGEGYGREFLERVWLGLTPRGGHGETQSRRLRTRPRGSSYTPYSAFSPTVSGQSTT